MTVDDEGMLDDRFEAHRNRLRAVAVRMLGSGFEADDAVQEAWLRLGRVDPAGIDDLGAWLTTVVARICLDGLRARAARPGTPDAGVEGRPAAGPGPDEEVAVADEVGVALLVVLDTLGPAERVAFVLHDLFGLPFEEIAPIVERTPVATRKLASRARQRVRTEPAVPDAPARRQEEVVAAFLDAARHGRFAALLELLDPGVVLRADAVAVEMAAQRAAAGAPALSAEVRGPDAVSRLFAGGARTARLVRVDGLPGVAAAVGGGRSVVFDFTVLDGRVVGIDLLADPVTVDALEVERLSGGSVGTFGPGAAARSG